MESSWYSFVIQQQVEYIYKRLNTAIWSNLILLSTIAADDHRDKVWFEHFIHKVKRRYVFFIRLIIFYTV